ncbi:hypothetical protein V6N11_018109 [Hibiscus sabdariffa]|uniref:Uncharacterized protein n=1 Tax=Hibiscus sabdariffa TaxID=183260 RepID=A0ABR2T6E3_9ROSI
MLYLSPSRDEYYMVAAGNSLALNRGIQEEQVVPARYRQEFLTIAWEQVHLRSFIMALVLGKVRARLSLYRRIFRKLWVVAHTPSWARVGPGGGRPSRDTCSACRVKKMAPYGKKLKSSFVPSARA